MKKINRFELTLKIILMKKTLALVFFILAAVMIANAQIKTVKLSQITAGSVWGGYSQQINIDKSDTSYYVYLNFYANHIGTNPVKSIYLLNQVDLSAFIKDMETALTEMSSNATVTWTRTSYSISIIKNSPNVYIYESSSDGSSYTYLKKSKARKLIKKLKLIQL